MDIRKTGVILYTREYKATVAFYKTVLELPILYVKDNLACFDFCGSYLMVEQDDEENLIQNNEKNSRDKFCVRFNVDDVSIFCTQLKTHSVKFDYYEFDWGQLAKFRDPDGNLIGIRSNKEHLEDIQNARVKA